MIDLATLDYEGKTRALEQVACETLALRQRYAEVAGECARLKAELTVLRQVASAIQSALRAERES